MTIVLPDGTIVDTAMTNGPTALTVAAPNIAAGLERLRDRIRGNPDSVRTLTRLHAIKNTMGYGLNSFLDHDEPARMLEHLVIGSEGTLAFIVEATFRTVPLHSHAATGLLVFETLVAATAALPALVDARISMIELLDAASLRVAQSGAAVPDIIATLEVDQHAGLLVELQADSEDDLDAHCEQVAPTLAALPVATGGTLTDDANVRAQLWHIRKGIYTAVAGARPTGTTALLEDIAVPVPRLGDTCSRLIRLFATHGYEGSVIFGHAKDGNIHFLINERFDEPEMLQRYEAFTEDLVTLVLEQGGTLRAEHGTGRIMAPFVPRQYGPELFDVMLTVKQLIDPAGQFNPGVLLTDDTSAHLRDFKSAPTVEDEVNRCVECGYCEPVCPSRDITLTPRQRIVLRREMQWARERGDDDLLSTLQREYDYDGVQTCAVDGMCQTACPVLINTGDLVRRLRAENLWHLMQAGWKAAANHWDPVTMIAAATLRVAKSTPVILTASATKAARALLGADTVPEYSSDLPTGGARRTPLRADEPDAIYFSSCTTTMFSPVGDDGVADAFLRLCSQAGVRIATPNDIPSLCCGMPWKSKGLTEGYAVMQERVIASLQRATDGGRRPVVCDASSCSEGLVDLLRETGITVIDAVEFVDTHVLPHLLPTVRIPRLTLHPTCSSVQLGISASLSRVAAAAAAKVVIPDEWACCGFAGDRGMLHPELTESATALEARTIREARPTEYASLNRTCEMGMSRATGKAYRHVLQVLDDAVARNA